MSEATLTHAKVEKYLLSKPDSYLDFPFGEAVSVYKIGDKMFALINNDKLPLSISLKSDPLLAKRLVNKYESVMPGWHLNKKHWITIVLSGQLSWPEVQDLITLSYNLVKAP